MRCKNCGYYFSYKEKLKLTWGLTFNNEVQCPDCGKTHYLSQKSLAMSYLILLLMEVVLILGINLFDIGIEGLFAGLIIATLLLFFLFPFTMKIVEQPDGLLERQFREMENKKLKGK
ncbi:hypothetical protein ERX37_00590 [Macrococcus hajekii]|uniref:Cxxc_20_cxxc protein n=1 Tax=Macrococcus hajekii TaxID=198482 RepID=A0A4R6BLV9_9STAP|nr:TIGR04104 family putative zinc finger protein [Macrococcus hajekii]TDM02617.1 hypothetical protein ERX37_00590 [Macrococcus hajekii]GGB02511.1 hypothetical protein GCM10007190_08090 [Macrococcus hajekii]